MLLDPKTKRCARCGRKRLRKFFYKNSHHKDGLGSYCKTCSNMAVYTWKAKHPSKVTYWAKTCMYNRYWKDPEKSRAEGRAAYRRRQQRKEAERSKIIDNLAVICFIICWLRTRY